MTHYPSIVSPFMDYGFMRRALTACTAIALSGTPLGVFLVLRRMALIGDAISHAILPGASIAFLWFGLSVGAMTIGGLAAGLLVAIIAGVLTRFTQMKEDASFTGMYLISLATGVLIISMRGSVIDLMHVLFGNVLGIDNASLKLICVVASISLLILSVIYRTLIAECFDTGFMRSVSRSGAWVSQLFLVLVVLNLVCAFQALGTLMALGIMVLPAIAARFWMSGIDGTIIFSVVSSFSASFTGLMLSYYFDLPSGPAIVLTCGALYLFSALFGRFGSIGAHFYHKRHFAH